MGSIFSCLPQSQVWDLGVKLPAGVEQCNRDPAKSTKQLLKFHSDCTGVIARSFAGTSTTDPEGTWDWVLGPKLKSQWDDPRRLIMMEWFAKFIFAMTVKAGFTLQTRRDDGEVGAVLCVLPYLHGSPSTLSETASSISILSKTGIPPFGKMGDAKPGIQKRMDIVASACPAMRKKHLPGPHIYVVIMAVDPSSQGLGFCSKLMRSVNVYADSVNLPLYLETSGTKNVTIYERFGYRTVEQFTIDCPKDPDRAESHDDEFAMVRPASAS
eukprot:TRINITY_DN4499_c0_g2_i1.p1 TRINITY_DN4499_c0_g2~~TRINITY_DN4499_c0_g2_i1.p1  ORF type:complete len:269 (+),score=18.70 TRINITY_DN4499_c0_g2_i1:67-873(+)